MPDLNTATVRTLTEYTGRLEEILVLTKERNPDLICQNWYRGVDDNHFRLQPGLFRVHRASELEYLKLEAQMMQDFERHAILRGTADPDGEDKRSRILKLFHMQHYSVPTRLLDWSTNPFTAMYFALSTGMDKPNDPCVWVMDPWAWNEGVLRQASWGKRGPAHVNESAVQAWHPEEDYTEREHRAMAMDPAAVLGVYNTERMRAQRGVFSIFGKGYRPMEEVYADPASKIAQDALFRIDIDRGSAPAMLNQLIAMGFTDSVAYPDFQGVAKEIRRTYGYSL